MTVESCGSADDVNRSETMKNCQIAVDPYAEALREALPANVQGGVFDPDTFRYQVGANVLYLFKE